MKPSLLHRQCRPGFNFFLRGFQKQVWILVFCAWAFSGSASYAAQISPETIHVTVDTAESKNLFWDEMPVLRMHLENKGAETIPALHYELHAVDLYHDREAGMVDGTLPETAAATQVNQEKVMEVPYGVYRVKWSVAGPDGEIAAGSLDIARMLPRCYRDVSDAIRTYDRHWSIFGGVFGFYKPELATDMGTRWNRFEETVWDDYEKEPGRFDMAPMATAVKRWKDAGVECLILQTLYQRPDFYTPEQPGFARAYGSAMQHAAESLRGLANAFELGNEDNGPTRMLYTEVARNAAAAIRSAQPGAFVANSGTAYIDLGWLDMQASRKLYDTLDIVCTHPYTADGSPETWNIYEKLEEVNDLVDRVGGMKLQWTTEFGWPHDFSPQKRAEWIPRHFVIGAAAGVERHGLYTWERDYGVFQGTAQPAAAAVHTLAKMIEGSRFAGLIQHDDTRWVAVFERAGQSVAVGWSPKGDATWSVPVDAQSSVMDLFGNPVPANVSDGKVDVHLTGAPAYVMHPAGSLLAEANACQVKAEYGRLLKCMKSCEPGEISDTWAALAAHPEATRDVLQQVLETWTPKTMPITLAEQAVVAQALRWYWIVGRLADPTTPLPSQQDLAARRDVLQKRLEDSVAADIDIPSLRYLMNRWERLADEEAVARAEGAQALAERLLAIQGTIAKLCECFAEKGLRVGFALWPYLYDVDAAGALREKLRFIPGQTTTIKLRVNSYAHNDYKVLVSLELPEGWTCDPANPEFPIAAGQTVETEVRIACPPSANIEHPALYATLRSEGLPDRKLIFEDTVVEAPVEMRLDPVEGLLPGTPVKGHLSSLGTAPLDGLVRIVCKGDTRALARLRFTNLVAGTPFDFECSFPSRIAPAPYHEWPLSAEIIASNGQHITRPIGVDFACAVRAQTPPKIDGDVSDWACATPLHLDREEYAKGSFGTKWTPEDCSATTYVMWDDVYLYFAAVVKDQTFNQTLSGSAIWMQDSVQLAVARDTNSPYNGFGLALTPQGEQAVRFSREPIEVAGCQLKVVTEQSKTTYEAAIPWSQIDGIEKPAPNQSVRYSVLVNDDDAVTGRRFLERYGGIAYDNQSDHLGHLKLLADAGTTVAPSTNQQAIFIEDFEEYDTGTPDAWETVMNLQPFPDTLVKEGAGRNASKGLVLTNTFGEKPNVYRVIVRPLAEVHPDQPCELRFWARGHGLENPRGIVGICSDKWGNEAFSYADLTPVDDTWREIRFPFSGPSGGNINIIIRNAARIDELVLDDFEVVSRAPVA